MADASVYNAEECPVWAITTYRRTADKIYRHDGSSRARRERRTVGLFPNPSDAARFVLGNLGDLEEAGYYQFAVVEPLAFGLYPVNRPEERLWFEFQTGLQPPSSDQTNDGRWVQLDQCPDILWQELGLDKDRLTNWSEVG